MRIVRRLVARISLMLVFVSLVSGCAGLRAFETVESLLRQGKELYAAGRYDEALGKLQEVIRRDPKSWEAYLYLARTYIATKSWQAAIDSGRKAFELAPTKTEALPVFGEALLGAGLDALRRGQFGEAIGRLTEYVRLRPTDVSAYLHLGRAYLETGAYADALRAFVQGLGGGGDASVRRDFLQAVLDGGTRALAQGDARSAIAFLQEYVRHDPGNLSGYLSLGKAYWATGDTAQALSAFRRVLELSPGNEEALRFLRGGR